MASSGENQGLQIALIIFVILTIILSVTTFLFFREYDRVSAEQVADKTARDEAQGAATKLQGDLATLKGIIGAVETASVTDIQTKFEADKTAMMSTYPPDTHSYSGILPQLTDSNQALSTRLAEAQASVTSLQSQLAAKTAELDSQTAMYATNIETLTKDLDDLRLKFEADRDTLNADKEKLSADLVVKDGQIAAAETRLNDETQRLTVQADNTQKLLTKVQGDLDAATDTNPDPPDGRVVWVNQKTGLVWINLGQGDYLRRQTTFSVHARDANSTVTEEPKGRIEITQILGEHLAEAKILDDDLSNPILPSDAIYTPLWDPGRQQRFALIGKMDLDGDRQDDRPLIRNLITMNGGVIDAEGTDTEERHLSVNTRFVVKGDDLLGEEFDQARQDRFNQIVTESRTLGVDMISVQELIKRAGFKDTHRVVKLGEYSDPDDFRLEVPDGGMRRSNGNVSGLYDQPEGRGSFNRRQPPGNETTEDSGYRAP